MPHLPHVLGAVVGRATAVILRRRGPALGVFGGAPLSARAAPKLKGAEHFLVKIRKSRCNDCATAGEKVRRASAPLHPALSVAGVGSRSPAGGALASMA